MLQIEIHICMYVYYSQRTVVLQGAEYHSLPHTYTEANVNQFFGHIRLTLAEPLLLHWLEMYPDLHSAELLHRWCFMQNTKAISTCLLAARDAKKAAGSWRKAFMCELACMLQLIGASVSEPTLVCSIAIFHDILYNRLM